jgi:periplasmic divalent cation tolerance protein
VADTQKATAKKLEVFMDSTIRLLYVTCPDKQLARHISRTLLSEGLTACSNILPGMESHYFWEGKLTSSEEVVLILKTTADRADRVTARVESLHPYDTPCILSLPVEKGSEPYVRWIKGAL